MPADDLGVLSDELRSQARVDPNGEVSWHVRDAPAVLSELGEAGRVVLGLDMRDYDDDGTFLEIAWSVYNGADPVEAREAALEALERGGLPGEWAFDHLALLNVFNCRQPLGDAEESARRRAASPMPGQEWLRGRNADIAGVSGVLARRRRTFRVLAPGPLA